ncbi:hypothetical protein J3R30DRAFT_3507606 [Lentinula aciculospora]|uniref:Small RNA 2'-O-methyltransferase n=1 Tax=Lentinula aciculospora TaxID=153920 RepID=A0A9W9DK52_9AGAR|nr:hypothetical protein J3R30DRAFT_3507606 [Lentinula aciculospora]
MYGQRDTLRWEETTVTLWKAGFETINEEFVGVECIVSMEVIEHLSPSLLALFAPTLLGIYKPKYLLLTTPSYTFNTLFTSPSSGKEIRLRAGYADPTGRSERVFRHVEHQFEWTREEFGAYCEEVGRAWGYEVLEIGDVGRALERDEWGRDGCGGASLVAMFKRIDINVDREDIQRRARAFVLASSTQTPPTLVSKHIHPSHPSSKKPLSLCVIGGIVVERIRRYYRHQFEYLYPPHHQKNQVERYHPSSFLRIEDLWYEEKEISEACGGWIELLICAIEQSEELVLVKDDFDGSEINEGNTGNVKSNKAIDQNIQRERDSWKVCLADGLVSSQDWFKSRSLWVSSEGETDEEQEEQEEGEEQEREEPEYEKEGWEREREEQEEDAEEFGYNVSGYLFDDDDNHNDNDDNDKTKINDKFISGDDKDDKDENEDENEVSWGVSNTTTPMNFTLNSKWEPTITEWGC